jgi:hypothetical protein
MEFPVALNFARPIVASSSCNRAILHVGRNADNATIVLAVHRKNSTAAATITPGFSFVFEQRKTGEKQTQDHLFGVRPLSGSDTQKIERNGREHMNLLSHPSNFRL